MSIETPSDWKAALRRILDGEVRRVLVLGAQDAGKSTFGGFLLAEAAAAGRAAALLDADPGQKQIGPPACVTLGRVPGQGAPVLSGLAFIGRIEPLGGWSQWIAGSTRLVAEAKAECLIINSCGLLRGPGRRLKKSMISALQPDLLVAIGESTDLNLVLADHRALPILHLASATLARRKGGGERRALRRAAFQSYFEAAPVWSLPTNGLHLASGDGEAGPALGRLLAVMDAAGRDMALGLVTGQEPPCHLLLRSPPPDRPVAGLRWGRLGLDTSYQEHMAERPPPD